MISAPPQVHRTRLRDFGAFQGDISALETREVAAARVYDHLSRKTPSEEIGMYSRETQHTQWTTRKKRLSVAIRFGATIALCAILFRSVSWPTLQVAFAHMKHSALLIGLSIGTLGVVISSYQWRILLQGETIHCDLADLIHLYLVGTAFSHFLPTGMGGDAVKAMYVGRESGKNEASTSAVVMSRVTGFLGMLLIAIVMLTIHFKHFSLSIVVEFLALSLLVGAMIFGAVLFVTLLPKMFKGKWTQQRIFASISRIGNALSATAKRPRFLGIATMYGVVFWVVACLNYYTYAIAIGMHVPLYFYFVAIPLVSLVTFLPISINGFGVRESTFVYIFSTVHTSSTTALLLALLMDAQVLFFGVVGGCLYFWMGVQQRKKKVLEVYVHDTSSKPLQWW